MQKRKAFVQHNRTKALRQGDILVTSFRKGQDMMFEVLTDVEPHGYQQFKVRNLQTGNEEMFFVQQYAPGTLYRMSVEHLDAPSDYSEQNSPQGW